MRCRQHQQIHVSIFSFLGDLFGCKSFLQVQKLWLNQGLDPQPALFAFNGWILRNSV